MKLPPDWNEFIGLLNGHRVRYVIVGAHALAANGRPRATQDVDVFIDRSKVNVARLKKALTDFGFEDLASEADRFCQPAKMATLGAPPLRIDIMNHIDGVSFKTAWAGRVRAAFGDHMAGFLGLTELRKNKLASGRPKDLADLALIEEMKQALSGRSEKSRRITERKPPRARKRR